MMEQKIVNFMREIILKLTFNYTDVLEEIMDSFLAAFADDYPELFDRVVEQFESLTGRKYNAT